VIFLGVKGLEPQSPLAYGPVRLSTNLLCCNSSARLVGTNMEELADVVVLIFCNIIRMFAYVVRLADKHLL
jgi:hypothetical protein